MQSRTAFHEVFAGMFILGLTCTSVQAQWSILAPGKREAPVGQNRYAMLVFANPVPGLENDFNDWYTTTHMGDLVQLPGWMGAQRFRIVSSLNPRPTREGYRHGYGPGRDRLECAPAPDDRSNCGRQEPAWSRV